MATTTATATPTIPDTLAKLRIRLTALGDGRDARSDNERAAYRSNYDTTQRCISGLMNAPDDLADAQRRLADAEAQRAAWLAKEAEIEQAIATAPERDKEMRQRQLQLLRNGVLFVAPGVTLGSLSYIEGRIAELTGERDRAQSALDAHLKQAAALLAVPVAT